MPPKKVVEPPKPYPDVEEEFHIPEDVGHVPEPTFCLALAHLFGHTFKVLPPAKPADPAHDGAAAPAEAPAPEPVDFDPKAVLLLRAKAPATTQEDLLAKRVATTDREELHALSKTPEGEERPLTYGLRLRLERERAARARAKWNAARRRAVAAHEAAKAAAEQAAAGEEAAPAAEAAAALQAEATPEAKADFVLLTVDYPANIDEVRELAAAGLCEQGVVDLWAAVYLAGIGREPTEEERAAGPREEDDGGLDDKPHFEAFEPPELVRAIYGAIQAAPLGSELAGCTVCTVRDAHTFAFPPEGMHQVDRVEDAVLAATGEAALARHRYGEWLNAAVKVSMPGRDPHKAETRLYHRMMSAVDPSHHDVPLFLHCLTEQVERTLGGEAQRHEDDVAVEGLAAYLGAAFDDLLSDGACAPPKPIPVGDGRAQAQASVAPDPDPVLSHLDRSACTHLLGSGGAGAVIGGERILDSVRRVVDQVRVAGARRQGMPRDALQSASQRQALAHRLYPFAPGVSPVDLEQLMLLHAFEELLNRAQPERRGMWSLSERTFRERIPADLLPQTLEAALRSEAFVSTAHIPRHDALLVALHYRSPACRVMWHAWRGDLFADPSSERWQKGLFTTPTFNDWAQVFGGQSGLAPRAAHLLDAIDAREFGYCTTFEKLATPSDGSVIIVTRMESGLGCSFPEPSNDNPHAELDVDRADRKSVLDDAASSAAGAAPKAALQDPTARLRGARCEVPAARATRLARIIKDGHVFGIVADRPFDVWRDQEHHRRAEAAAAHAARAAAAAVAAAEAAQAAVEGTEASDLAKAAAAQAAEAAAVAAEEAIAAASGRPLADVALGSFWLSFPGGARCTARMHHERALEPATNALPSMGVLLSYTLAAGHVVQILGDGSICLSHPLQLCEGAERAEPAAKRAAISGHAPRLCSGFAPGCPEDQEVLRSVTPDGRVCRRLLSGRAEVYHPDGTAAWRNPTAAELAACLDELRARPGGAAAHAVDLLERIITAYKDKGIGRLTTSPSEHAKAEGLPGHWVVVCPDGRMYGRARAEAPAEELPAAPAAVTADAGGQAEEGAAPTAPAAAPPAPMRSLQELLSAVLVDDGATLEYEVERVPAAMQEDLLTKHRAATNAHGLASFEDPQGLQKVSVFRDGTQITRTMREGGMDIEVLKEPFAFVRCEINDGGMPPRAIVECADGAILEVEPRPLSADAPGAMGFDPRRPDLPSAASRAHVVLSVRGGSKVVSPGNGTVQVLTRAGASEQEGGCYEARCLEGRIVFRGDNDAEDVEGNFELHADQSLHVPEPTDPYIDKPLRSPRCAASATAYKLPGTELQQAPEPAHPPRLFIIYGDGEAEELLDAEEARALLEEADDDPNARVVEGPEMDSGCRSHTLFRRLQPDAAVVPPLGSLALPENFEKSKNSVYKVLLPAPKDAAETLAPAITEHRQLIELPKVTAEDREKFKGTLKQYREWEAMQLARSRFAMLGPDTSKGKKDGKKDKKAEEKKDKKAKKGKGKNAVIEVPEEPEELPPEPAFVQDFRIGAFDHHVQVLKMRAASARRPDGDERLRYALEARAIDPSASADMDSADGAPALYTVRVQNISFDRLCERPELFAAVRDAVKAAFAQVAGEGALPEHVVVDLSAGSLVVAGSVSLPPGASALIVGQNLAAAGASGELGDAVAAAVAGVEGIDDVATGGDIFSDETSSPQSPTARGLAEDALGGSTPKAGTSGGETGSPPGQAGVRMGSRPTSNGMGTTWELPACSSPTNSQNRPETPSTKPPKKRPEGPAPCFQYFQFEAGVNFLKESGVLEREPISKAKVPWQERRAAAQPAHSAWNPRLVGEEPEEIEAPEELEEDQGPRLSKLDHFGEDGGHDRGGYPGGYASRAPPMESAAPPMRGTGMPIIPERADPPVGPHPDKKSSKWDHKGELRPPKPPMSQAYMEINTKYLEVEGATDRRVRTSSVAHKKNAARAPSVQEVRKTGAHAVGRGTTVSSKDLLGDIKDAEDHRTAAEEHWKLTSTMQGLGDSNNLVQVIPGACRFGPLCLRGIYRMSFYVRNLDVDVMRYVITSSGQGNPPFVRICHTPGELVGKANKIAGHLAPGMAKKVTVEIAAHTPTTIQELIDITVKAHHIKVPVFARILDVEEYEKEDYQQFSLNHRHIGRSHGDAVAGKPPPVDMVSDPMYCDRVWKKIDEEMKRAAGDDRMPNNNHHLPPLWAR